MRLAYKKVECCCRSAWRPPPRVERPSSSRELFLGVGRRLPRAGKRLPTAGMRRHPTSQCWEAAFQPKLGGGVPGLRCVLADLGGGSPYAAKRLPRVGRPRAGRRLSGKRPFRCVEATSQVWAVFFLRWDALSRRKGAHDPWEAEARLMGGGFSGLGGGWRLPRSLAKRLPSCEGPRVAEKRRPRVGKLYVPGLRHGVPELAGLGCGFPGLGGCFTARRGFSG